MIFFIFFTSASKPERLLQGIGTHNAEYQGMYLSKIQFLLHSSFSPMQMLWEGIWLISH